LELPDLYKFHQEPNTTLARLLRDGTITPRIEMRLPMSEAAEANRLVEKGGLRGRVMLMTDEK
jgi:NADPH:quinone reductase-like Zn-dependent oxidoreductase